MHYNGDSATAELLFRMNHFRVYGAVSDWCEELALQICFFQNANPESHPMLCQS